MGIEGALLESKETYFSFLDRIYEENICRGIRPGGAAGEDAYFLLKEGPRVSHVRHHVASEIIDWTEEWLAARGFTSESIRETFANPIERPKPVEFDGLEIADFFNFKEFVLTEDTPLDVEVSMDEYPSVWFTFKYGDNKLVHVRTEFARAALNYGQRFLIIEEVQGIKGVDPKQYKSELGVHPFTEAMRVILKSTEQLFCDWTIGRYNHEGYSKIPGSFDMVDLFPEIVSLKYFSNEGEPNSESPIRYDAPRVWGRVGQNNFNVFFQLDRTKRSFKRAIRDLLLSIPDQP